MPTTIVLMGLRGSGKSTLGRGLADALGRAFIDLDDRTAAALGFQTPGEALRTHGEAAFRKAEADALQAALREPGIVLALGGGTPTAPGAADLLRELAGDGSVAVLYLHASPQTLAERLIAPGAPDRPALVEDDPVSEITTLYEQRDPLYRELAGSVLHLDGVGEDAALAMVTAWSRGIE
ncbi:MAG: shikimate kinase [Phycisphaerales bacterium]|nr:shikimate kinase [Phycisphaerales bacterium]